jgi:ankyrin repeat protein
MLVVSLTVLALLQAAPSGDRNGALFDAIEAGDSAKVDSLLKSGANANARSRTYPALVWAFFSNKPDSPSIIATLLKAGADPSAAGSDTKASAQLAAEQAKPDLLRVFLDSKLSPDWTNKNRESLLAIAAALGNVETVRFLIERGANLNSQDDEGFTALMNACQNRHVEVVRMLAGKGADKSLKSKYGDTALSLVAGKYEDTQAGRARKQIADLLN